MSKTINDYEVILNDLIKEEITTIFNIENNIGKNTNNIIKLIEIVEKRGEIYLEFILFLQKKEDLK